MRMLPFSLLLANGLFGRHGPWWIIVVLSSVGNVPSWKKSAIRRVVERHVLTPELPVHVVLVPPFLVPPLFVPPAASSFMRWYRWCNVNRIAVAIFWIALGCFVFARCGGYKKAPDFTRAGHRIPNPVDASSLIFLAAPEAYKHGRVNQSTARERLGPTTSKNAAAQQAQGELQCVLYVSVSALREFWIICIWYADKLVAQLNGCASSTSQANAPMRWRRTNISHLPCTQKIIIDSGAPRLCLPCLPCRDATV